MTPDAGWPCRLAYAMTAGMTQRTPKAGGFLLILPIVTGFTWGLATGHATEGAVAGLAIGIVLALIVWAVDRRQG